MLVNKLKSKQLINLHRLPRADKLIQKTIPINKTNNSAQNYLLHKTTSGNLLIKLDQYNNPISAFTDSTAIMPIKVIYIKNISKIIRNINTENAIVYYNDGYLLKYFNIPIEKKFYNKKLNAILGEIKIKQTTTQPHKQITFSEALELVGGKLTKDEYLALFN